MYANAVNRKFVVPAAQSGSAFVPITHLNLDRIFAIHHERVVARDNTIQFANRVLQVPSTRFRATLAGCRVMVYEHLDGMLSIGYGPHTVARFRANGEPLPAAGPNSRPHHGAPGLDVDVGLHSAPKRSALRASLGLRSGRHPRPDP